MKEVIYILRNNLKMEKRISMEEKMSKILDKWEQISLSKTEFGTRKNQYEANINNEKYFGKKLSRLITKIYNSKK